MRATDHLVYASPDLNASIADLFQRLGVRATQGGSHPGRGTRNALLGLGPGCYLEIVGPEEGQRPAWFMTDEPRLLAWAVRDADLEGRAAAATALGMPLGPIAAGSRRRPDGQLLQWRFTDPAVVAADGIVPFFIDWGQGPHPTDLMEHQLRLVELRLQHPNAAQVEATLRGLGVDLPVASGRTPKLSAILESPLGLVEI